jgi:hypothetical protein
MNESPACHPIAGFSIRRRAISSTKYDYSSLADAKWVASRIQFSRRRENLSFLFENRTGTLDRDLINVDKCHSGGTFAENLWLSTQRLIDNCEIPRRQRVVQNQIPLPLGILGFAKANPDCTGPGGPKVSDGDWNEAPYGRAATSCTEGRSRTV